MRIASNVLSQFVLNGSQSSQQSLAQLEQQISTGNSVTQASDNPLAYGQASSVQASLAQAQRLQQRDLHRHDIDLGQQLGHDADPPRSSRRQASTPLRFPASRPRPTWRTSPPRRKRSSPSSPASSTRRMPTAITCSAAPTTSRPSIPRPAPTIPPPTTRPARPRSRPATTCRPASSRAATARPASWSIPAPASDVLAR